MAAPREVAGAALTAARMANTEDTPTVPKQKMFEVSPACSDLFPNGSTAPGTAVPSELDDWESFSDTSDIDHENINQGFAWLRSGKPGPTEKTFEPWRCVGARLAGVFREVADDMEANDDDDVPSYEEVSASENQLLGNLPMVASDSEEEDFVTPPSQDGAKGERWNIVGARLADVFRDAAESDAEES